MTTLTTIRSETKFGLESRCKTLINSLQLRKVDVSMTCYDALESYIDEAIKSAYNAGVRDTTKLIKEVL